MPKREGLSIKNSALPFNLCKCSCKLDVCLYMASGLTSSKIIHQMFFSLSPLSLSHSLMKFLDVYHCLIQILWTVLNKLAFVCHTFPLHHSLRHPLCHLGVLGGPDGNLYARDPCWTFLCGRGGSVLFKGIITPLWSQAPGSYCSIYTPRLYESREQWTYALIVAMHR